MQIEHLKTEALAAMAAPYNPRRMSEEDLAALRRSLTFFGVVEPVVVNRRTGRIVGGHQRVKAAEAEGIETLPVVHVDLDEPSEKQLNLACQPDAYYPPVPDAYFPPPFELRRAAPGGEHAGGFEFA
jgi:hypothetical protein